MKEEDSNKKALNNSKEILQLNSLNLLEPEVQNEKIREVLEKMYGESLKVSNKHIMKVVRLTCRVDDDISYLPFNLKVEKRGNELSFAFSKRKQFPIAILFVMAILFAAIGATFSAITILSKAELNKDINGDGIADINLDLNDDGIAEINIDLDNDNIPDISIDYKSNKLAMFNIPDPNQSIPKYNLLNQDIDDDGVCDINCDVDGDGWPDMNIDYFGKGKATLDVDSNKDGIPDMNLDTNGDGTCDINCDTDDDGKCDENCIPPEELIKYVTVTKTIIKEVEKIVRVEVIKPADDYEHDVSDEGDKEAGGETVKLFLIYNSGEKIVVRDVFPDDQPEEGLYVPIPEKVVTIENPTPLVAKYSVKWVVDSNTFRSDNFQFKVTGTNGASSIGYTPAPGVGEFVIFSNVEIQPRTIHQYSIQMNLKGTGEIQDYDQGRSFSGIIEVFIED